MLVPSKTTETEIHNPDGTTTVQQIVAFEDLISTNFVANKHTYHPSGYTHTTDKNNERHVSGIKSLPFDKIENFQQIAIILPQDPVMYPSILDRDLRHTDVVLETELFQESPFQIDVYILRQNKGEFLIPPHSHESVVNADIMCEDTQEFSLFIRCWQSINSLKKPFPPKTFHGTWIIK